MKTCHKDLFEKAGLKNTLQRDQVYHALQEMNTPVTVESLYLHLKNKQENISLSTIYRILEAFLAKDMVIQLLLPESSSILYELRPLEHGHHLICLGCKRIIHISGCPLGDYEQEIASKAHFQVVSHKLDIFGYCKACQTAKETLKKEC